MDFKMIAYNVRHAIVKHAPKILGYGGAAVSAASSYFYIRGGKKFNEGLTDEIRADKKAYAKHAIKCYGPAVGMHAVGTVASVVGLQKSEARGASYAAGLVATAAAFNNYRENVKKEFGDEADIKAMHMDAEAPAETPKVYDNKLVRFISEINPMYDEDHGHMVDTFKELESYYNRINKYREVSVNEIFSVCHVKAEKSTAYLGYPKGYGKISFHIEDVSRHPENKMFIDGYENCLIIDLYDAMPIYDA